MTTRKMIVEEPTRRHEAGDGGSTMPLLDGVKGPFWWT